MTNLDVYVPYDMHDIVNGPVNNIKRSKCELSKGIQTLTIVFGANGVVVSLLTGPLTMMSIILEQNRKANWDRDRSIYATNWRF